MQLFKSIVAAVSITACSMGNAMPAKAGSHQDSMHLIELIEGTGTQVSFNSNGLDKGCKGHHGYYQFAKDEIDLMVVCKTQTDTKDANALWETVAHESMHIAQACAGHTPIMPPEYHPRLLRELRTLAPHYAKQLSGYRGDHQLKELEAFWAELQTPQMVIELFEIACYEND